MLEQFVNWMAYGALTIGAISAYLHLNKLWSRKHIPEVAASISITGNLLEALPMLIFGMYYLTRGDPVGVIDTIIWLLAAIGFIMIGSGYWVQGRRKHGLLKLAIGALKSESREVGNLVQSMLHPISSKELVTLLQRLAEVDGNVSQQEADLVNNIAEQMNVDIQIEPHTVHTSRTERLLNTLTAMRDYLQHSPPKQHVERLELLLHKLASSDQEEHEDEASSLSELQGVITDYLQDGYDDIPYRVLLAPQSEDQVKRIQRLLEGARTHDGVGGSGITIGEFHTREYADAVCHDYRELGFFCVVTDEKVRVDNET